MRMEAELVYETKAVIGEGPCWDDVNGLLYYVDIMGKKVNVYDPTTNTHKSYDTQKQIGALVLDKDGKLVAAAEDGYDYLDLDTGTLDIIAGIKEDTPGTRFNDGKCDSAGRFWAGTMGNGADPVGALYVMDTDKSVRKMAEGITISNGLAWSLDDKTMYYIDSVLKTIDAFDYDIASGDISNRRTVVRIPGIALPDGMTIDTNGFLWVAEYFGSRVSVWNPITGTCVDEVALPVSNVTSCTFGGHDMKTLFITSALNGLDDDQLSHQPLAGALFKLHTNVMGARTVRYKG